jgi:hypothetical protein
MIKKILQGFKASMKSENVPEGCNTVELKRNTWGALNRYYPYATQSELRILPFNAASKKVRSTISDMYNY